MRHNSHRHLLLLATLLLTLVVAASRGDVAGAAEPDFTNVTDILGGQTHLLRDDDLVLGQLGNFQQYAFLTQGLQVASQSAAAVVTSPCGGVLPAPLPFQTRVGRLFNLKNDVVVKLIGHVDRVSTPAPDDMCCAPVSSRQGRWLEDVVCV